jgi:hypothetical protein
LDQFDSEDGLFVVRQFKDLHAREVVIASGVAETAEPLP